jgi:hypothetical protein
MNGQPEWATTVDELIELFHRALVGLVPIAEQARIPWREGEAYDDWDAIASVIYENLVMRSLQHSQVGLRAQKFAPYDTVLASYDALGFIAVRAPGIPTGDVAAFVGFAGLSESFPAIKHVRLSQPGGKASPPLVISSYGAKFYFAHFHDGIAQMVEKLNVSL